MIESNNEHGTKNHKETWKALIYAVLGTQRNRREYKEKVLH